MEPASVSTNFEKKKFYRNLCSFIPQVIPADLFDLINTVSQKSLDSMWGLSRNEQLDEILDDFKEFIKNEQDHSPPK